MKILTLLTALFSFKKPLITSVEPSRPRWSIVNDAVLRAESQLAQSASVISTELLIADDELSYAELMHNLKTLIRAKETLTDLRGKNHV